MGSSKHQSFNGRINQDYSVAKPLICCLCHEPYEPLDHFGALLEGISPMCEECLSHFQLMDSKEKFREVTFWVVYHHTPWFDQIYDNLIRHHMEEPMKGLVWPIQWFIHDYVAKRDPVFVFLEPTLWVSKNIDVLRAWKRLIYPPRWRKKPMENDSVGLLFDHTIHWGTSSVVNRTQSNYLFIIFHLPQLFSIKAWIDKHLDVIRPKDKILVFSCKCR